jgi:ankyrin repeat protein
MTALTAAIMAKDSILVDYLMGEGAAVNNPPNCVATSMTPLSAAVRNRNLELVDSLIQQGADPYDPLALEEATNDIRLLQVLLKALHGCNKTSDRKGLGSRVLDKAVQKQDHEMVRAILNSPLRDIKSTNMALSQALLYDSSHNFEIIRILLNLGADPNTFWLFPYNPLGPRAKSALCVAIDQNNLQKVQLLLEAGAQVNRDLAGDMHFSPMQLAVSKKNQDVVRKLLDYGSNPNAVLLPQDTKTPDRSSQPRKNGTPVQIATENRDTEMVRLLLQYKGDPNTVFGEMKHTPLQMASRDGSKEMVELLLEQGADVNSPSAKKFGATALQFAAIKGLLGIAYLLLENGADVNAPPAEIGGRTALEGAAEHGRIDMVQLLLNAGANISQDQGGQSQYENAARRATENSHRAIRRLLESYHG